ncbi:MAG: glycyl-radical enzyme activating protein [Bacteroidales bacterium]|jgi:pyruvate formate lyase activating enzyme|nr:glycyl-radical enzyme activating protein [Bacteroidales bacterium]
MLTIFDIKRFALHDGPGIRTTVFLKGCPLRCLWCHNPESHSTEEEKYDVTRIVDGKEISMSKIYGKEVDQETLLKEILNDQVFYEESNGGVTFSGGEPLMQHKALINLLKILGEKGIHRAVDTSGYANREIVSMVAEQTDLFLFDLKLMDSDRHKEFTGVENQRILENADLILDKGVELIFRVPVIPGINDSDAEINALMKFLTDRKDRVKDVHLLPYHKIGMQKYSRMAKNYSFSDIEEPEEAHMLELKQKIESCGVDVTIGG